MHCTPALPRQSSACKQHAILSLLLWTPSSQKLRLSCTTQLLQGQPRQFHRPCCHPPPDLRRTWMQLSILSGGGIRHWLSHHHCLCQLHLRRRVAYVNVRSLVVELADAMVHERPVLRTRTRPPTHPQHWGGFLCQLLPSWHKQTLLVARRCRPLRPRPLILRPSPQSLWWEGMLTHSNRVELLPHCGSARNASFLIALAVVMALVLPTKRGLLFAADVIGLALPTNLLGMDGMDGLKRGGGEDFVLILRESIFSNFFVLWETCFLTKFASLGFPFLVPFGGLSLGALLFFCIVQLVSFLVSSSFLFCFMATP